MSEMLAAYEISINLYFSPELLTYIVDTCIGRTFHAKNGISISYSSGNTPGFGNGMKDTLYLNESFNGKKRSLMTNFQNIDDFEQNKEKIFDAIRELKAAYLKYKSITLFAECDKMIEI